MGHKTFIQKKATRDQFNSRGLFELQLRLEFRKTQAFNRYFSSFFSSASNASASSRFEKDALVL